MGEQIEDLLSDLKTGPTLTFDAPVEEEDVSVKEEEKKPELEEVQLTEEEKRMVDQFAKTDSIK